MLDSPGSSFMILNTSTLLRPCSALERPGKTMVGLQKQVRNVLPDALHEFHALHASHAHYRAARGDDSAFYKKKHPVGLKVAKPCRFNGGPTVQMLMTPQGRWVGHFNFQKTSQ